MNFTTDFQPHQIVCLEHEGTCLYAEVIQVVVSRQLCWVRPLVLSALTNECSSEPPSLIDVRSEADLIWPITLFRPALDTEVVPLLATPKISVPQLERNPAAGQQLYQFIHQVLASLHSKGSGRAPLRSSIANTGIFHSLNCCVHSLIRYC